MRRESRRERGGFTLLEVVIALLLTAIAVTIAASALRAATTARDSVLSHQRSTERSLRVRAQLTDMLRHAPAANAVDEPLLRVLRDERGAPTLVFLTTGVRAPYGTGSTWRVTLSEGDSGVVMDATPIGASRDATRLHSTLTDAEALSVQVLERAGGTNGAQWRSDWPLERTRPAMIALQWRARDGADTSSLVVSLDPLTTSGGRP